MNVKIHAKSFLAKNVSHTKVGYLKYRNIRLPSSYLGFGWGRRICPTEDFVCFFKYLSIKQVYSKKYVTDQMFQNNLDWKRHILWNTSDSPKRKLQYCISTPATFQLQPVCKASLYHCQQEQFHGRTVCWHSKISNPHNLIQQSHSPGSVRAHV